MKECWDILYDVLLAKDQPKLLQCVFSPEAIYKICLIRCLHQLNKQVSFTSLINDIQNFNMFPRLLIEYIIILIVQDLLWSPSSWSLK